MSTSNEQKIICNKIDGAPEQQDDNQPRIRSINSSSNIDAIDAVVEGIDRVTLLDNSYDISKVVSKDICAACGKEGKSCDMNTCNKCKSVKYCNAACKKKHRSKHKKACERRVAELYDEQLFKDHTPTEECPICLILLPIECGQSAFHSCCGKAVCGGCIYAMTESEEGQGELCPFCRMPSPRSDEEDIKRIEKLMDKGNAVAFNMVALEYEGGGMGLPKDHQKDNKLYLKAGELGCAHGYYNLGNSYYHGRGVVMDEKKAKYFYELSAMNGSLHARYNLGMLEYNSDNMDRAYKHLILAARAGHKKALEGVKEGYTEGDVTKDEYANTLRAHHERQKETKSDMRDKAAASGMFSNA